MKKSLLVPSRLLVEVAVPQAVLEANAWLQELPSGIAVIGGAARSIARAAINGEHEPIRDVDLCHLVDVSEVSEEELDNLGRKFMPDDYANGHGVQSATVNEYFSSRDFTVNEVLIHNGKAVLTPAAYKALKLNIVELSAYEAEQGVSSRMCCKALYLACTFEAILEGPIDYRVPCCTEELNAFDCALFLNKAMSRSRCIAERYTEEVFNREDLISCAYDIGRESGFEFRDVCSEFEPWEIEAMNFDWDAAFGTPDERRKDRPTRPERKRG